MINILHYQILVELSPIYIGYIYNEATAYIPQLYSLNKCYHLFVVSIVLAIRQRNGPLTLTLNSF